MKTINFLAGMALMLATASQAQFNGTVILKSGERVHGLLLPKKGELLVIGENDTMRLKRQEISDIFVGKPIVGKREGVNFLFSVTPIAPDRYLTGMFCIKPQFVKLGTFFQFSYGPKIKEKNITPDLSSYIEAGYNVSDIKIDGANSIETKQAYNSATFGVSYSIKVRDAKLLIMGGLVMTKFRSYQVADRVLYKFVARRNNTNYDRYVSANGKAVLRNESGDRNKSSYMIGVTQDFGRIFSHGGYIHEPRGIMIGFGYKI